MTGTAHVLRANARRLPLADASVDLICTSPPYFALRSYQDDGAHYLGQIGDEPTPAEFVASLLEVTRECVRVLKPSGSLWVNLGDKYSGAQAQNIGGVNRAGSSARTWAQTNPKNTGIPNKSLCGIPWRYALACIDELGLILRAEVIWSKPNGLPESVTDRVRRSHEVWFHFTLEPRYFSAVDEIREPTTDYKGARPIPLADRGRVMVPGNTPRSTDGLAQTAMAANPLGKLPGSVWTIPTEPLRVPDHLGVDHFAAFPTEWPKRIISGWSPAGVCVACGEGRRPVVAKSAQRPVRGRLIGDGSIDTLGDFKESGRAGAVHGARNNMVRTDEGWSFLTRDTSIVGSSCACGEDRGTPAAVGAAGSDVYDSTRPASGALPPTKPGVVLDVFGGTGTTAMVAKALGRTGISIDMSADYCRLARWRVNDLDQLAKAQGIKRSDAARAADNLDMDSLFDLDGGAA